METNIKQQKTVKIQLSFKKGIIIAAWTGLLMSFATTFFVLPGKIFAPGLSGISSGIAYTIGDITKHFGQDISTISGYSIYMRGYEGIYWLIYGLANVPIVYFMLKNFSRRFFWLSITTLIVNILISQVFITIIPMLIGHPFLLFDLSKIFDSGMSEEVQRLIYMISMIVISCIGGIIYGYALGTILKIGGCSMGLDPVAKWIAAEKGINISNVLFVISITNSMTWIFIRAFTNHTSNISQGGYIWPQITNFDTFIHRTIFAPELLGTFGFLGSYAIVSNRVYSSNKKVRLTIKSEKIDDISKHLININYHRGHSIFEYIGGYSKQNKRAIEMIIKRDELYDVLEYLALIDQNAFITVEILEQVHDIHDWRTIKKDDFEKFNLSKFKIKK